MIQKNEVYTVSIENINSSGFGVCRIDNLVTFVSGGVPGDALEIKIIKVKKNYCIGRIEKIVTASDMRIEHDCDVFTRCGGCVYRHIRYEDESKIKWRMVRDAFQRIGHMDLEPQEILSAEHTERYRNKAQYPVSTDGDALAIGFYSPRSHKIVSCMDCKLQPEVFLEILNVFEEWIRQYRISVYQETVHKGLLRHIYIRRGYHTGEIMVCAVVNGDSLPHADALIDRLTETNGMIKSIVLNVNKEKTNVITGKICKTLWGADFITDILCGIQVRISPLSFYQVNTEQAERLYKKAAEYAALTGRETLLDLYCGAGTIGLSMADKVGKLIGVEIVPEAVEDAKINAQINQIENAEFLCSDAQNAAKILEQKGVRSDVIVVDPPRKGCSEVLLKTVAEMAPERIVYVSCDCATLARDCAFLRTLGYDTKEITPVDMFPRTAHVETVVLMSRVDK